MRALLILVLAIAHSASAQEDLAKADPKKPEFSSFTVDIDAPAVSAGGLVGLEKSAIQHIETSQDFAVAIKPFGSGDSKSGFGLSITPARTALLPMPFSDYAKSGFYRTLGSLTFSYAENAADISGVSYRKYGVSADVYYYLKPAQDPILIAHATFARCVTKLDPLWEAAEDAIIERKEAERKNPNDPALPGLKAKEEKARKEYLSTLEKCEKDPEAQARRSPWNANRVSLAIGAAWLRPEDKSRSRESLGRAITVGGVLGLSEKSAAYFGLRHTTREADLTTLAGPVQHKKSNLAAARYVYGNKSEEVDAKMLAEISNAKSSTVTEANHVFKYALGFDRKIAKGTWLQFRLGRNRTIDGTSTETTALMTLNLAPTAGLFK
jgi:hypothetical protein